MDLWNRNTNVVMTEEHGRVLVDAVAKAVAEMSKDGALETYRQMARLELDLARARDEAARTLIDHTATVERKDQEIASLRGYIASLQALLATMAPPAGAQFNPYNNNGSNVMTHPIPMPAPPVVVPPVPMMSYQESVDIATGN